MSFLPGDFEPPKLLETERFRLRPITIHDVVKDYEAVMTSLGPASRRPQLGCVYVDPSRKADAEVAFWVRSDELDTGLERDLEDAVRAWIPSSWPFENVAYPGRDISWEDLSSLPDKS